MEHAIWIPDVECLREMMEFQYIERSRAAGQEGGDDRAMAVMIALRVHVETAMKSTGCPPRLKLPEEKPDKVESYVERYVNGIGVAAGRAAREVWDEVDRIMDQSGGLASQTPLDIEQFTGFPDPEEAEMAIDHEPDIPW